MFEEKKLSALVFCLMYQRVLVSVVVRVCPVYTIGYPPKTSMSWNYLSDYQRGSVYFTGDSTKTEGKRHCKERNSSNIL